MGKKSRAPHQVVEKFAFHPFHETSDELSFVSLRINSYHLRPQSTPSSLPSSRNVVIPCANCHFTLESNLCTFASFSILHPSTLVSLLILLGFFTSTAARFSILEQSLESQVSSIVAPFA